MRDPKPFLAKLGMVHRSASDQTLGWQCTTTAHTREQVARIQVALSKTQDPDQKYMALWYLLTIPNSEQLFIGKPPFLDKPILPSIY